MAKGQRKIRSKDEIFAEEDLVLDVQFLIEDLLSIKGLSRADLAAAAGLSKARITQLMGTSANPTLRNVAKILHALDERMTVSVAEKKKEPSASQAGGNAANAQYSYEASSQPVRLEFKNKKIPKEENEFIGKWIQEIPSNDDYCANADQDIMATAA